MSATAEIQHLADCKKLFSTCSTTWRRRYVNVASGTGILAFDGGPWRVFKADQVKRRFQAVVGLDGEHSASLCDLVLHAKALLGEEKKNLTEQ